MRLALGTQLKPILCEVYVRITKYFQLKFDTIFLDNADTRKEGLDDEQIFFCKDKGEASVNGKSLSWTGLTQEWWCCTVGLVSRLDMSTCPTSIKTDILLVHC